MENCMEKVLNILHQGFFELYRVLEIQLLMPLPPGTEFVILFYSRFSFTANNFL